MPPTITLRVEPLEERSLLSGVTDFLVNTTTVGNQLNPAVAADGQGNFITVWEGFNPANGTTDIFAQRTHADGSPDGGEILVNAITAGAQQFAKVAADTAGDFVVVWRGPNPANNKIDLWGRRFNSSGQAVTGDVLLDAGSENFDSGPQVAMSADGSKIVVTRTGRVTGVADIYAQLYDANLNPVGGTFMVNQVVSAIQSTSRVAMDAAGNFIVTWNTTSTKTGLRTVDGRRFDAQGNALTGEFSVGTDSGDRANLALAWAPDGGFLALWDSANPTTHNLQVWALRFDAGTNPGTPFAVSDPATNADLAAASFDGSGNSLIVWQTTGPGFPTPDVVHAQRYDAEGNPTGAATIDNALPASDQSSVAVAESSDGTALAAWASLNSDHTTDIRATLDVPVAQPPVLTSLTGTTSGNEGDTFQFQAAATDANGDALTYSWDLNGDGVFGDATGPNVQTVFTLAGTHTVSVQVTNAHNQSVIGSLSVQVQNVAPIPDAGPDQTINQGTTATFHGSATDPGAASETFTYIWDFNYDGQTFQNQAFGADAQNTFSQPGTYTVALEVLDDHGGVGLSTLTVTVLPVAPVADAGPDQSVTEGSAVTLHGSASSTVGPTTNFGYAWTVTRNSSLFAAGSTQDFTFTPADDGVYLATLTVTDSNNNTTASASALVTATEAPLQVQTVGVSATEGSDTGTVTVATFTDTGVAQTPDHYTAQINWGDGTPVTMGTIQFADGVFTVSADHTYAEEGQPTFQVTVSEDGETTAMASGRAIVSDAPLSASGQDITATEGASTGNVTVAAFTDQGGPEDLADYSAAIDWGDGSGSTGTIVANSDGSFSVQGSHTCAEEGTFALAVTITHGSITANADSTVTVQDAPLTARAETVSAIAGAPYQGVVASFTDADPNGGLGDYSATITWGDGHTTTGTIVSDGQGGFNVVGTTTYAAAGTYTLTVQIADVGGSTATVTSQAAVTSLNRGPERGQREELSFWRGQRGQQLIGSFNGGPDATTLGNWLAANFSNLFGALAGKTNTQVAAWLQTLSSSESSPLEAQVLATALNVYASTLSLGGDAAQRFGFLPTATGLGAASFRVGDDGTLLGISNHTTLNVWQILQAANSAAQNGRLDGSEQHRALAGELFARVNSDSEEHGIPTRTGRD